MAKKLQADEIRFVVNVDAKGVDSDLYKLSSETKELNKETQSLKKALKESEKNYADAQAKIESYTKAEMLGTKAHEKALYILNKSKSEIDEYSQEIRKNTEQIAQNKAKADELVQTLKVEDMTMNQLKKRAEELRIQLDKTSQSLNPDTYNQLQNELNGVNGRMGELKNGAKETENVFAQFTSGVNKYWAAIVVGYKTAEGAFSTWKDLMLSNKATGEDFKASLDGINEALDYAKVALVNLDFTNFIDGMTRSYEAGRVASKMLAELFERQNSFDLTTAPVKAELENLKTQLRDVNISNKERLEIGNQIIEKTKEMAALQKDIIKQEITANEKKLDAQLAMTEAEKQYVIFNYNANLDAIRNAKEIIELENKRAQFKDGFTAQQIKHNNEMVKGINEQIAALKNVKVQSKDTGEWIQIYSEDAYNAMKKYLLSSDEMIKGYVDAQKKAMNVNIQTNRELRRTETMMNGLKKKENKVSGSSLDKELQKQKKDLAELNNKIETKYLEDQAEIKRKYKNNEIKTESEYNRKIFANEQAYYILREEKLKAFVSDKTKLEVKDDVSKQIAQIQDKQLSQEIKFKAQLEKTILDANPIEKEKKEYKNRLDALNLIDIETGEIKKKLTTDQFAALEVLEKQHKENLEKIDRDADTRKKVQSEKEFEESFSARREELQLELNQLMQNLAASGRSGYDTEMEVHLKRLQMITEEYEARRLAGLNTTKQVEQQGRVEAAMTTTINKELQKRAAQFQQYGNTVGQALGDVMTGQENALKAFGDASVDIVFDILSKIIEAELIKVMASSTSAIMRATAEAMATPQSALSFGAAGFATAAILTGAITAATVAAKSALKGMLGKKKGSSPSSSSSDSGKSSGNITVKQRAEGKYDVMGADDRRIYRNVPYSGDAKTGVVSRPTLMGERGSELVVSHPDFMALQKHINYPVIMQAIQDARFGRVQQRAEGKYDGLSDSINIPSGLDPVLLQQLTTAIDNLNKKEFKGNWGVTEYQAILTSMNKEDNRFVKQ